MEAPEPEGIYRLSRLAGKSKIATLPAECTESGEGSDTKGRYRAELVASRSYASTVDGSVDRALANPPTGPSKSKRKLSLSNEYEHLRIQYI